MDYILPTRTNSFIQYIIHSLPHGTSSMTVFNLCCGPYLHPVKGFRASHRSGTPFRDGL